MFLSGTKEMKSCESLADDRTLKRDTQHTSDRRRFVPRMFQFWLWCKLSIYTHLQINQFHLGETCLLQQNERHLMLTLFWSSNFLNLQLVFQNSFSKHLLSLRLNQNLHIKHLKTWNFIIDRPVPSKYNTVITL